VAAAAELTLGHQHSKRSWVGVSTNGREASILKYDANVFLFRTSEGRILEARQVLARELERKQPTCRL
jgi:hypothetical protein